MGKKYFVNCANLEELKKEYKKLAMMYHPDRPNGNEEIMKAVNNEYEYLFKILREQDEVKTGKVNNESVNEYKDIIDQLIKYNDITVSIVGTWLWCEGSGTKAIKEELKALKFFWNSKRSLWQRKPDTDTEKHRGSKESEEQIKNRYGCQTIKAGVTKKNTFCLV